MKPVKILQVKPLWHIEF